MSSLDDYEKIVKKIEDIVNTSIRISKKIWSIQDIIIAFREEQNPIPSIYDIVLQSLNFPPEDFKIDSRKLSVIRQLMAWFYWNYSFLSLRKIANKISQENYPYDHSTVHYSINKIDQLLSVRDKETRIQISIISVNIKKYYIKVDRQQNLKTN